MGAALTSRCTFSNTIGRAALLFEMILYLLMMCAPRMLVMVVVVLMLLMVMFCLFLVVTVTAPVVVFVCLMALVLLMGVLVVGVGAVVMSSCVFVAVQDVENVEIAE
jgi:hypothetical protein